MKLPQLHAKTVTEVFNNSQIWIFYDIQGSDTLAVLNRNNSISTTNWLFNFDRRLKLKHLFEPFNKILVKRHKKSMHHVDGMRNYFSFSDTIDRKIKSLPFDIKIILYKNPLKDTVNTEVVFYTGSFSFRNKNYTYKNLDSILKTENDWTKTAFYYQDKLTYDSYLKIKAEIYTHSKIDTLIPVTDFYFK